MEDDQIGDLTMLMGDEDVAALSKRAQSKPTKQKVQAFKNRVYRLIQLFVEHAENINPLTSLLTEQLFKQNPSKIRQIIISLLPKNNISQQELMKFSIFFKNILLFKEKKQTGKYAEDLINILKKIKDEQFVTQTLQNMLEVFALKRNCKLNQSFFLFVLRKVPGSKKILIKKATELKQSEKIRPAQKRYLQKMLSNLTHQKLVKQQNNSIIEQ